MRNTWVRGGANHRGGLDDGVLIKANHVRLAGGVREAVRRMKAATPEMPIEVEVHTLAELDDALAAGADIVLVDCVAVADVREAVRRAHGRAQVELCGEITLDRVAELAATGADYVSIGAITQSAPAANLRFDLEPL